MITGELKSKIDRIWDAMWAGGIANPLTVIEQLTYLLFIKRLDELHTIREAKANRLGKPIEDPIFTPDQTDHRWSHFRDLAAEPLFTLIQEKVFPFIKDLGKGQDGAEDSTYATHMKDALFMFPSPRLLANVVDQLDSIDMADQDTKGDLYEYMLGKIASAGQNGQFRTPRHIIQLMVEMTDPQPSDTICDPACGTCGFLVAAAEFMAAQHSTTVFKDAAARQRFSEQTFFGYDFDTTMLRIGSMNMLLHGIENPDIRYKDSLEETNAADTKQFSLILANPPFSGSLDYEATSKKLLNKVKTKKTELLFLALFDNLLAEDGRAAVIVPSGVLESDSKAHTAIRKLLVDDLKLEAVIKLPHWVFKPYASVDTSILLFSKTNISTDIWFYRVDNDGFANDAQKTPILGSDLKELLKLWQDEEYRKKTIEPRKNLSVSVETIRRNNYDLCPPRYLSGHEYPKSVERKRLDNLFTITKGTSPAASANDEGPYPFITSATKPRRSNVSPHSGNAIVIPTVSATGHGHASIKHIHYVEGPFDAASITAILTPIKQDTPIKFIYYYLLINKDELLVPLMRGSTNKSLNIDRLAELEIPILSQQHPEGAEISELMQLHEAVQSAENRAKEAEIAYIDKIESLRMTNL